jgi:hypothetical protein
VILNISNSSSLLVTSSKLKSSSANVFMSIHDVCSSLWFLFNFLLLQKTLGVTKKLNAWKRPNGFSHETWMGFVGNTSLAFVKV